MAQRHNYYGTRFYRVWSNMKDRCNHRRGNGKYYFEKGISYNAKWENFNNFLLDMKAGYAEHLTLDRIDCTKGYSKRNCRWVTVKQQMRNKTNNRLLKGKTLSEWSEILKIKRSTLAQRYYVYKWPVEKTLSNR